MWTSKFAGRLIDLDLYSVSDEAQYDPGDVPLTFSTPFLAVDLLTAETPQPYLYRHDLESFYWSFIWIVLDHLKSTNTKSLLGGWWKGSKQDIAVAKQLLFQSRDRERIFYQLSRDFPSYSPVFDCLIRLTELVTEAYKHLDTDPRRHRSSMDVDDERRQALGETEDSSHIEATSTAQPAPEFDDSYITAGGYIT